MKTYKTEVVTEKEKKCVKLTCDICSSECQNPSDEHWGEDNDPRVYKKASMYISDCNWEDFDYETIDLCPSCAEWIMKNTKKIREMMGS